MSAQSYGQGEYSNPMTRCGRPSLGLAVLAVLAVLTVLASPATGWAAEGPGPSWVRDQWTMRHGLPQNSVTGIAQDEQGFIWMTTYGGVVRFDGRTFERYDTESVPGLDAQRFLAVALAGDEVWLGSEFSGLYRMVDGSARRYGPPQPVYDVLTRDGYVYAATEQGLLVVHDDAVSLTPMPVAHLYAVNDGVVAGGMDGKARCVAGTCAVLPDQALPLKPLWWGLGSGGVPLAGTCEGGYRWVSGQWERTLGLDRRGRYRPPLCTVWNGKDWCATGGVPHPMDAWPPATGDEEGAVCTAIFVDREGGLWLGLDGEGVVRYQPADVQHQGESRSVQYVAEAPAGQLWWGNVTYITGEPARTSAWPQGTSFWQEREAVALGVFPDGEVHRLSAKGDQLLGRIPLLATSPLEEVHPYAQLSPPVVGPWFVSDEVLYEAGASAAVPRATAADLGAAVIRPLRGDAEGVWLLLDEKRLVHWTPQGTAPAVEDVGAARVRDLLVLDGHTLWLATYGAGMLRARDGKIDGRIAAEQGGCDSMVSHFYVMDKEILWVNTNHGLGQLKRADVAAAFDSEASANCTLVGSNEGNGALGLVSSAGQLIAPTVSGVARVTPDRVGAAGTPHLILKAVSYGDANLLAGELAVGSAGLHVQFAGIYFRSPHSIVYRYRLQGLEPGWSAATSATDLHFQNLPPGRYVLQLQSRGLGGWGPPTEFAFERLPDLWERPLYKWGLPIAALVLIIGSLVGALTLTRHRAEALREEVARRVRLQEELEAQQAENSQILRQREAAQRLEALGRLAGGIAHDFNNLFQVIAMRAEMLTDHEDPDVREEAEGLREVVDVGAGITKGLLRFGHRQPGPSGVLDVAATIEDLLPLLRRLIRSDLSLRFAADAGCTARLYPGQLDQILTNLVTNARDATEGPGGIDVEVRRTANEVVLSVRDQGRGMSGVQTRQAFEPYFTTKTLERGTGLGLTTVHSLVRDAGGQLTLDSELGRGTVVEVRLPFVAALHTSSPAPPTRSLSGLRILAVEDRADVRQGLSQLLRRGGAVATVVENLGEAEAALETGPVDLLISDIIMPVHNGPAVRTALRRLQPGLPTLFITGYMERHITELGPEDVVLHKPFTLEDLQRAAAKVLGPDTRHPTTQQGPREPSKALGNVGAAATRWLQEPRPDLAFK